MNATGSITHSSGVTLQESRPLQDAGTLLTNLGLEEHQVNSVLANPKHGPTLEQLYHPQSGVVSQEPGGSTDFILFGNSQRQLPPDMLSLAEALAGVSESAAAHMLAVALVGQGEPALKIALATLCASAWQGAGLPPVGEDLGKNRNQALQDALHSLLAQHDIPLETKSKWGPVVQHDAGEALKSLASLPQPGSYPSSEGVAEVLTGKFYAALLHHDGEVMEKVLEQLRQWPDEGAQKAWLACAKDFEQVAPTSMPPLPSLPVDQRDNMGGAEVRPEHLPPTAEALHLTMPETVSSSSLTVQELNLHGPQILADAAWCGDLGTLRAVLESPSGAFLINVRPPPGVETLLNVACKTGNKAVVAFLLQCPGVDVNACFATTEFRAHADMLARSGKVPEVCPLLLAAARGYGEIVAMLLDHPGMDLNQTNRYGQTPLCQAARSGQYDMVALLLKNPKVDATMADVFGATPLHVAAHDREQREAVGLFLELRGGECGTLANLTDLQGNKPLHYAMYSRREREAPSLEDLKDRVMAELTALTTESPSSSGPFLPVDYSQTLLLVGPEYSGHQRGDFEEIAARGGVAITHVGDGIQDLGWTDLVTLASQPGGCAIIQCHGGWDEVENAHILSLGHDLEIPTEDVVRLLYEKGVRKMTFFSCEIATGAENIVASMNHGLGWPKPLDPQLEITFVGGKHRTATYSSSDDMRNRLADIGSLRKGGSGDKLSKLSAASTVTIKWGEKSGLVEMERTSSLELDKRGDLSDEEYRLVVDKLITKYCFTDQMKKLEELLALEKVGVNFSGPEGFSPLYMAVAEGRLNLVEMLVGKDGIDLNKPNVVGHTPLHLAAVDGRGDIVAVLLEQPGIDVNKVANNGRTPLHIAAELGNLDMVKGLIGHSKLALTMVDDEGDTPLTLAALSGHADVVAELLQHPEVNVNHGTKEGMSPLYYAAYTGNLEVVKLLAANGAVDSCPAGSALEAAIQQGNKEVVDFLNSPVAKALGARTGQ